MARLATYRDSSRPTFVGQEFASMIERIPSLTQFLPDLKRYLLDFPKTTLPKSESFLYWQEAEVRPQADDPHQPPHDYRAGDARCGSLEDALRQPLLLDPAGAARADTGCGRGEGFWFVSVNRSRSDGLSGFVG